MHQRNLTHGTADAAFLLLPLKSLTRTLWLALALVCLLWHPSALLAQEENYVIAPNDLLQVKVFQEDDLDTVARVSSDGTIILPLIESVQVGGKTVAQAAELIKTRYRSDRFLVNPQVGLAVMEYSKRLFTILGQVQKPGSYAFPDNSGLTLLQAIGFGGGYTKLANPSNIVVRRKSSQNREQVFKLNAKSMARDNASASFSILPNDVITVGETLF